MTLTEHIVMQKQVKPISFLFYRTETTIQELANFLPVAVELYKEATAYDLRVTGPVHWHYIDFTGDVSKSFILEIALPVAHTLHPYDGQFHFKRTESFKCVSMVHEGDWNEIPGVYESLMEYVKLHQFIPTGTNREVYINVDFDHPEANTTEVQLGVH